MSAATYFSGATPLPAPRADGLDREFWEAARRHRLAVQRCSSCGRAQFLPDVRCTNCQSPGVVWEEVPATGTLTSYTRVWHPVHPSLAANVPYLVGVVEVEPGARMVGNIVGDPLRYDLAFDMPMSAVFEDHDDAGVTLIHWEPRRTASS